jgi:hypothetical protein
VIVSWFKPLDETFDGPFHTDEIYIMVVNGLTDPTGTAADCLQEIRLNFALTNGITGLVMLDPVAGQLQTNTLPIVNGRHQLILNLNGGDAVLFKFSDGAPFVGWPLPDPSVRALVPTGAGWKYLDDGSNQGAAWRTTNFDDSGWASGPAPLGYGDGDEATVVRSNRLDGSRIITTYFRRTFAVTNASFFSNLTVRLLRDDGGVVYLNGVEVFRSNMPEGPIDFDTRASTTVGGGDESTNYYSTAISPDRLINGTNLLAVEIHQVDTNSSDVSFDLEFSGRGNLAPIIMMTKPANNAILAMPANVLLTANAVDYDGIVTNVQFFVGDIKLGQTANIPFTLTWSNAVEGLHTLAAIATDNGGQNATSAPVSISVQSGLVTAGSIWKYLDNGSNQATAWRGISFNDGAWASGAAQLGYGDGDEATVVGYGPDMNNKYITTYFRRRFAVTNVSAFTNLLLRVLRDDGAVVYVNGTEVFRSNMPGGTISYTTLASSSVPAADETTMFYSTNVSATRLFNGTNVLAVEVHQASTNSSDLSFDLELIALRATPSPSLSIRRASGDVLLTWSAFAQGFRLESAPALMSGNNWSAVANSVSTSNGQNIVSVSATAAAAFFRLRKP